MNWEEIAAGAWPDNEAFVRLSDDERLLEIRSALRLAADRQDEAPESAYRVGSAAMHLLDSQRVEAIGLRATLGVLLGVMASRLGRHEEAASQLRRVTDAPAHPDTASVKLQALAALGGLLSSSDREEAGRLLQRARSEAIRLGDVYVAANASVSLGAIQRRAGDLQGAHATLEGGIAEIENCVAPEGEKASWSLVLARLHGNLANLLTDSLERHEEAIAHYDQAIGLFDAGGESSNAASRWFQRLDACLRARQYETALAMLNASGERVPMAAGGLAAVVSDIRWLKSPQAQWTEWELAFERLSRDHAATLSDAELALLAAARIMVRGLRDDTAGALHIAADPVLRDLPEYDWRESFTDMMVGIMQKSGRFGLCWHLPWMTCNLSYEEQLDIREQYQQDRATLWLAEEARRCARKGGGLAGFEITPALPGIAAVPNEPPSWLAMDDPVERRIFFELRAAICLDRDAVHDELFRIDAAVADDPVLSEADAEPLRRAVLLADLLGMPELQVASRVRLASAMAATPGGISREVLQSCNALLEQAKSAADGLARQQIRVHLTRAELLKEAVFGDEDNRLLLAMEELRHAHALAQAEGSPDIVAKVAAGLGNALSETTMPGEDQLEEARRYLEEGLVALKAAPDDGWSGVLHNSLGKVYSELAEFGSRRERLDLARRHLQAALKLRVARAVPARVLTALGNLLGVTIKALSAGMPVADGEIIDLVERTRAIAPLVEDRRLRCGVLLNAVLFLRSVDPERALALGQDALALARQNGSTRILVDACQAVGRVHRHRGEHRQATVLFEEAVTALEMVRGEGGESGHRAKLSERYRFLYEDLQQSLEDTDAGADERWWAVERQAGRTLLENMGRRGLIRSPSKAAIADKLVAGLDQGCLLLQLYRSGNELRCLSLRVLDGVVRFDSLRSRMALAGFAGEQTPEDPRFSEWLRCLGEQFVGPLLGEIDTTTVTRIAIAAQGFEANVAWHAVPIAVGGARLGDRFDVVQLPNLALLTHLLERKSKSLRKAVFVACDPDGSLILHIEETLRAFSTIECSDTVVLLDQSRPIRAEAVLAACEQADLLHFSGHGVLTPGNMHESGLVLSDGLLSVASIERALSSRVPSTVVLSSCDSAAGDSRFSDAPTLASTFLQAGARTVIGAGWPVPDSIAAETTLAFYGMLSAAGAVAALNEARRRVAAAVCHDYAQSFKVIGWD